MKNARIHFIYLAIIGFLAYQYWTKAQALNEAVGSIEQFDKLLKSNNEVVGKSSIRIKNEIERQVKAYPSSNNQYYLALTENIIKMSSDVEFRLEKQKNEFISSSSGYEKKDSSKLVSRLSSSTSGQFFSEQKIKEIKEVLTTFEKLLKSSASYDMKSNLYESFIIPKMLRNEVFWQSLKNKTSADIVAQLDYLQNQIELDKMPCLIDISNKVGGKDLICGPTFSVVIAPQKAALVEGENFNADIYLAQYALVSKSDLIFVVNGRELEIKDGVASFTKLERSVGTKKVKVEARIRNPLTRQTITADKEFEYEVLPKCSRDCK